MRMTLRVLVAGLATLVGITLFAQTFERHTTESLTLDATGKALLKRVDQVPGSPLGVVYADHAKAMQADSKVRDNFLKEQSRAWSLLTGKQPKYKVEQQDTGSGLTRTLSGQYPGLAKVAKDDKAVREIAIKQFVDPKTDEKRQLQYYELVLDTHFFEPPSSGPEGQRDHPRHPETEFVLPKGAELLNKKDLAARAGRWTSAAGPS